VSEIQALSLTKWVAKLLQVVFKRARNGLLFGRSVTVSTGALRRVSKMFNADRFEQSSLTWYLYLTLPLAAVPVNSPHDLWFAAFLIWFANELSQPMSP
jgi:hypothetical protein